MNLLQKLFSSEKKSTKDELNFIKVEPISEFTNAHFYEFSFKCYEHKNSKHELDPEMIKVIHGKLDRAIEEFNKNDKIL